MNDDIRKRIERIESLRLQRMAGLEPQPLEEATDFFPGHLKELKRVYELLGKEIKKIEREGSSDYILNYTSIIRDLSVVMKDKRMFK